MPESAELRAEHLDLKRRALAELERVLEGQDFRHSRRGQLLLRYLVEHGIAGDRDSFKERTIGVEVFARNANYDTGQDAIVRVAANDVRKRLADHYERRRLAGDPAGVHISIPHGSYVPEFRDSAPAEILAHPPAPPVVLRESSKPPVPAFLLLILAAACCVLAVQNLMLRARNAPAQFPGILPWSMLSDGGKQMEVVVADSAFGLTQELTGRELGLPEYADGSWMNQLRLEHPEFAPVARGPITSVADVVTASAITGMLGKAGYITSVRSARSVHLADLKVAHPLVLLGSSYANPG